MTTHPWPSFKRDKNGCGQGIYREDDGVAAAGDTFYGKTSPPFQAMEQLIFYQG
jgi:hypothetical protein